MQTRSFEHSIESKQNMSKRETKNKNNDIFGHFHEQLTKNRVQCLHASNHVIIHVTMKQPITSAIWNHLHGCEDPWEQVVDIFSMVRDLFLKNKKQNRELLE